METTKVLLLCQTGVTLNYSTAVHNGENAEKMVPYVFVEHLR